MPEQTKQEFEVERHPYRRVVLYELTGEDVDQLEKETLGISEDFSFALGALTIAGSFSVALATTTIDSLRTFAVFWIVTLMGYLAAAYFGFRWNRGRRQLGGVLKRMRERSGQYRGGNDPTGSGIVPE